MSNVPLAVELRRCKEILWLHGRSPFSHSIWAQILATSFVDMPEYMHGADPFFFDLRYFEENREIKIFNRLALLSELSADGWRNAGENRVAIAVVNMQTWGRLETYLISLPLDLRTADSVKQLRIHAATVETFNPRACH